MTVEDNIRAIERWRDAVNVRDMEGVIDCYAPDAEVWSPRLELVFGETGIRGHALIREQQQVFFDTWPDGEIASEDIFGSGSQVCLLGTIGGTHSIPYTVPGGDTYPPTGRKAWARLSAVFTLRDGLIARNREYYDYLSLVRHVGVVFP